MLPTKTEKMVDKYVSLVVNRFAEEQPDRVLNCREIDGIWFVIYGMLCRGESEESILNYCKTVPLNKKEVHKPPRCGY